MRLPDPATNDELLGPLVVRGQRTDIIGAHTGEGKTTMTLQVVRAIVARDEFLGWRGPGDCRALIVDAEQGLRTIKRRLREARLDESDAVDYLRVPDGLRLDSDRTDADELDLPGRRGGYGVVAFDPLYKLHSGDSNAERAAVDLMRLFDSWRSRYHFALLLPVHLRKPIASEKFSIHDMFGSSAYTRGAEVVLGLRRASHGYAEMHFFKDRDGDLPVGHERGLLFDRESGFRPRTRRRRQRRGDRRTAARIRPLEPRPFDHEGDRNRRRAQGVLDAGPACRRSLPFGASRPS